jgi:hypothetical protein
VTLQTPHPLSVASTGVGLRIGILTFHRCINYGSYWQARCLAEGLRGRGHDAVLLDHYLEAADEAELACALQPLLPVTSSPADSRRYAQKVERFRTAIDELPLSEPLALDDPQSAGGQDLIVVGSDEVWNLAHPWYGGQSAFFGAGLRADRMISYAASFGNMDASAPLDDYWADLLRAFDAISVRDETSRLLVERATGQSPSLVLDPCLQFPPEPQTPRELPGVPYLAIYGHSMPEWFAARALRWARDRGYAVVSIGYRNDWADEQYLSADPLEFAGLIGHAAAVATNFFHGCVFALLREKPFVCAASPYRMNKVRDLTQQLGASAHLLVSEDAAGGMDDLLERSLDPAIARRLALWREQSDAFLDAAGV